MENKTFPGHGLDDKLSSVQSGRFKIRTTSFVHRLKLLFPHKVTGVRTSIIEFLFYALYLTFNCESI